MAKTLDQMLASEKPEVVAKAQKAASKMLLNIHLADLRERQLCFYQQKADCNHFFSRLTLLHRHHSCLRANRPPMVLCFILLLGNIGFMS